MTSWTSTELDVLLDSYMRMLSKERAGENYSKSEENRLVQQSTGRSKGAIEFKHCNISAVLAEMGLPYISGYKPRTHVQTDLRVLVQANARKLSPTAEQEDTADGGLVGHSSAAVPSIASGPVCPSDSVWDRVQDLWDRATGGRDVAAKPDASVHHPSRRARWPDSLRPTGVSESLAWFKDGLATAEIPRYLFLVGGPGAGKSSAAASAVEDLLPVTNRDDGLAHRTYVFQAGSRQVVLVNDATISTKADKEGALIRDIDAAINAGSHLIVCVNRGVLVEEVAYAQKSIEVSFTGSEALIAWLHSPNDPDSQIPSGRRERDTPWKIRGRKHHGYAGVGELVEGTALRAQVCAVFADVCSLLEERPTVSVRSGASGLELSCQKYRVSRFSQRAELNPSTIPAAVLMDQVMQLLGPEVEDGEAEWNPVLANIHSLTDARIRSRVLDIFRAGEIAAGKRMTYRELWGSIVKCLVGDLPATVTRSDVQAYLNTLRPEDTGGVHLLGAMRRLAELRYSQTMFASAERAPDGTFLDQNPVTEILGVVDPSRDAIPGKFDKTDESGWSSCVVEAFGGPIAGGSPLRNLLKSLSSDDPMRAAVTPFDTKLDRAFSSAIGELPAKERSNYYSWYGRYLTRLYAVAHGIPAFRAEICMWTNAWHMAETVPAPLKLRLLTLLQPARNVNNGESSQLIPVFDSRVDPIRGTSSTARLALTSTSVDLESQTDGDSIFLILIEDTKKIARVSLDFSLIREAMAAAAGIPGVTEQTDATAPRLERLRAARLTPEKLNAKNYMLVKGDEEWQLTVSDA